MVGVAVLSAWPLVSLAHPSFLASVSTQAGQVRIGPGGRLASPDPPPLETDLHLLTVSVTSKGNAVPGLTQDRFQILEDGVVQKIAYFWQDSRPVTIGFLMDSSNSMSDSMNEAIRDAGQAFLKNKQLQDEYFVINFSDLPTMVVSYTMDARQMPRLYPMTGESPLYDAIYLGLDAIKEAANPRKVLLVITAGANNGKGVTEDQLVNYAIKQPVQIYSLLFGSSASAASESANVLDLLAGVSGGRASITLDSSFAVDAVCAELAQALKTQYLIGYKSTNTAQNGRRRGVKVRVTSDGAAKLSVWTQSGYYGPKESKNKSVDTK